MNFNEGFSTFELVWSAAFPDSLLATKNKTELNKYIVSWKALFCSNSDPRKLNECPKYIFFKKKKKKMQGNISEDCKHRFKEPFSSKDRENHISDLKLLKLILQPEFCLVLHSIKHLLGFFCPTSSFWWRLVRDTNVWSNFNPSTKTNSFSSILQFLMIPNQWITKDSARNGKKTKRI